MIGFPYTKRLNSNNAVEQGAALILCSAERAEALGVPATAGCSRTAAPTRTTTTSSPSARTWPSPAMRIAGRDALDLAGVGVDDLAHVDLYSCFPSAVEIAADELGHRHRPAAHRHRRAVLRRRPWNNYVMHAIATMAGRLRADPGAWGW